MDPFSRHPAGHGRAEARAAGQAPPISSALERPILDDDESRLVRAAEKALGRDLSCYDPAFLRATLTRRMSQSGLDARALATALAADPEQARQLWRALNISYSTFFRDSLTAALLEQFALPALMRDKERDGQELRIWSAACAAGQEAYSVAMLLDDLIAAHGSGIRFRIFATDHHAPNLTQARRGIYDQAAVRNVPLKYLHYFTRQDEQYEVIPAMRAQVDFSAHDLLDPHAACPQASIFGEFDLIFCCNALLYYRPRVRSLILARLHAALAPHGFLVTDEAERELPTPSDGFRPVTTPGALFQKTPRQG